MLIKRYGALLLIAAVLLLALITFAVSSFGAKENESGIFDPANFSQIGQPPALGTDSTSYGKVSLDYIIDMNDNFYDRFPYTFREMRTAVWLVEELLAFGYTWNDIEVQEFAHGDGQSLHDMGFMMELFFFIDHSPFANIDTRPSRQSQNVILTVPGQSPEVIVVGAHYDSVFFPGASDNASGVALLLESAQRMLNLDNYYTIKYVFFGAEEVGLLGSFYYVNNLSQEEHDNLLFMICADILLDGDDLLYMAGYIEDSGYQPGRQIGSNHITESWDLIAQEINTHYDLNLMPLPWGVLGPSDQLAFVPFGHTAMFLAGLDIDEMPQGDISYIFMDLTRVVHSYRDDIYYIMETWPNKAERNMHTFSIFLEELLLATYCVDEGGAR